MNQSFSGKLSLLQEEYLMIEADGSMTKLLTFCETVRFSKRLNKRFEDDDYAKLQRYLAENPDAGVLIEGGGGIRKVRFAVPGRGKSGASG